MKKLHVHWYFQINKHIIDGTLMLLWHCEWSSTSREALKLFIAVMRTIKSCLGLTDRIDLLQVSVTTKSILINSNVQTSTLIQTDSFCI